MNKEKCGNEYASYFITSGVPSGPPEWCCLHHAQEYCDKKNNKNKKISKSDQERDKE